MLPVSTMFYHGSEELMQGDTTIIKKKECKEAFIGFNDELSTAVCARAGFLHGTCQGDSGNDVVIPFIAIIGRSVIYFLILWLHHFQIYVAGGPLICYRKKRKDPYLAGVVSFGFPVCNDGYHPDVYTDLGNKKICNYCSDYEKLTDDSTNSTASEESTESTDSPDSSTSTSSSTPE